MKVPPQREYIKRIKVSGKRAKANTQELQHKSRTLNGADSSVERARPTLRHPFPLLPFPKPPPPPRRRVAARAT